MVEVTMMKCACADCVCVVPTGDAVDRGGRLYCSDACATGHAGQAVVCGHRGCACHG